MKIAVFGCSQSGVGPRRWNETWPYILNKLTGLETSNFAIEAPTQFYDIFKQNIHNFDKFIFVYYVL